VNKTVAYEIARQRRTRAMGLSVGLLLIAWTAGCGPGAGGQREHARSGPDTPRATGADPVIQNAHVGPLEHIVFSPDRKVFLTTTRNNPDSLAEIPVMLWDSTTGDKLREFKLQGDIGQPRFCLGGRALVAGGKVFDIETGNQRWPITDEDSTFRAWAVSSDGSRLVAVCDSGEIRTVAIETLRTLSSFSIPELARGTSVEESQATLRELWGLVDVGFSADKVPMALLVHPVSRRAAVWNVGSREKVSEFHVGFGSARLSPRSGYVVTRDWEDTGSDCETTVVYDSQTGAKILTSYEWWRDPESVQFTTDERYCITGTGGRQAVLWDLKHAEMVRQFGGHARAISGIRLLEDDAVLETRSFDVAQRWDWRTGKLIRTFRAPAVDPKSSDRYYYERATNAVVVPSPDGKTFMLGNRAFDTDTLRRRRTYVVSTATWDPENVPRVTYMPDGTKVLVEFRSRNETHHAVLFCLASGKIVREVARKPDWYGLKWSRDGRRAFTPAIPRLWDVERGCGLPSIGTGREGWWHADFAFSENGKYLYASGAQCGAFFWNAETGEPVKHAPPTKGLVREQGLGDEEKHWEYYRGRSILSPDGRLLASWYKVFAERNQVLLWDLSTAEVVHRLDHGDLIPVRPVFSPDGRSLAITCYPNTLVVWALDSGRQRFSIAFERNERGTGAPFAFAHYLPGGQRFLVKSSHQELTLYCAELGEPIRRLVDDRPPCSNTAWRRSLRGPFLFSPDGGYAVADYGGSDNCILVWNLRTGKEVLRIERDTGNVIVTDTFQFSADSRRLRIRQQPFTIWDLESGTAREFGDRFPKDELKGFSKRSLRVLPDPYDGSPVPAEVLERFQDRFRSAVALRQTSDGRRLIVYEADGSVSQWDLSTGKAILRCYLFDLGRKWLTVMPDGRCYGDLEYVRYRQD
jgi:WD40 repeat protein